MNTYIKGKPVPQPRPRATRFAGSSAIRMYEPSNARAWKAIVSSHMRALGIEPIEGPIRVDLRFDFVRPRSHFTTKGKLTKSAPAFATGRNLGDVDNLAKAILDACNTILYTDDAQVIHLSVVKCYAKNTGVQIIWK